MSDVTDHDDSTSPPARAERLALVFICAAAWVVGVGLMLALQDAGQPRAAEIAGEGLLWTALGYTFVRWNGAVAPRDALVFALALLAWHAAWVLWAKAASLALWRAITR